MSCTPLVKTQMFAEGIPVYLYHISVLFLKFEQPQMVRGESSTVPYGCEPDPYFFPGPPSRFTPARSTQLENEAESAIQPYEVGPTPRKMGPGHASG